MNILDKIVQCLINWPKHLTRREISILNELKHGPSNKVIATRLGITEGTVKVYLSAIFHKTGAEDRFQLFTWLNSGQLLFNPNDLIGYPEPAD